MNDEWEYKIYYFEMCVLRKMPQYQDKLFKSIKEAEEFLKTGYNKEVTERILPYKQIVICSRSKVCNVWMIDKVLDI